MSPVADRPYVMPVRRLILASAIAFAATGCEHRRQSATGPVAQAGPSAAAPSTQPWPIAKREPYAWMPDEASTAIIEKRWESGSKVSLGRAGDEEAIRKAILEHMKAGKEKSVGEVRWMSADEVMASASWYSGKLAAAGYYYVLQRRAHGGTVVTRLHALRLVRADRLPA